MTDVEFACTDLTLPAAGSQTVRTLLSRYLARQYRDLLKLRIPGGDTVAPALTVLQRHCRGLAASAPGPLFSALQHSAIGGSIRFLCDGALTAKQAPQWATELAALLYAELALAGAPPPPMLLAPAPPRLIVASTGTAVRFPAGTSTVRLHAEGMTVVTSKGATILAWEEIRARRSPVVETSHVPLAGRTMLALADDSPLATFETHPDKQGNRLDMGGRPVDEWVTALSEALALVRFGVPDIADEIELLIEQLVPVGYDAERHLSASFRESIGTIYLSLHPEVLTIAEALIHEHAHNKINMLWTLAPVLTNGFTPLYASPFRPDPRPLHGVLLGVHAFLPVERLYEQLAAEGHPSMRLPDIDRRRARVRERNAAASAMLARHAQPTASGRSVMDEIARWDAHFA
jgi:HEXXH motif-containing protein